MLAYEAIAGRSLDRLEPAEMTDEVLAEVWSQFALMRAHRIAHRDLRLANVFLADDGEAWIIDFGFSELAASDQLLATDLAELLASSTTQVGAERAVAAGLAAVGPAAIATSLDRLQLPMLSGATRTAMKADPSLLPDLRAADHRIGRGGVGAQRVKAAAPGLPGAVEVAALGVATVDLEDHHAVGEAPQRLRAVRVAGGEEERLAGPLLEALGEQVSPQPAAGGEPVPVGAHERGGAVRVQDAAHHPSPAGAGERGVEHVADVEEHVLDEGGLEGGLVRHVLVERRRPHAEVVGQPPHREGVAAPRRRGSRTRRATRSCSARRAGRAGRVARVGSTGGIEAEHRVVRGDAEQRLVGRGGVDAVEELADLDLPAGAGRRGARRPCRRRPARGPRGGCGFRPSSRSSRPSLARTLRTHWPWPARRHEVLLALVGEEVHGHPARLAGRAAGHLEHPAAPHAHARGG